jgi:ATP-dependent helicase/nuclease subunit A
MTRARDRLYIAGYQSGDKRAEGCWYDLVCEPLTELLNETTDMFGEPVRRLRKRHSLPPPARRRHRMANCRL